MCTEGLKMFARMHTKIYQPYIVHLKKKLTLHLFSVSPPECVELSEKIQSV